MQQVWQSTYSTVLVPGTVLLQNFDTAASRRMHVEKKERTARQDRENFRNSTDSLTTTNVFNGS